MTAIRRRMSRKLRILFTEIMRLGPTRPIVMISGEAPYLLDRLNYLNDVPYTGRFQLNPMHVMEAAQ
jgi:type IV secretory pathway TraG/TraD family ATPase VirD4